MCVDSPRPTDRAPAASSHSREHSDLRDHKIEPDLSHGLDVLLGARLGRCVCGSDGGTAGCAWKPSSTPGVVDRSRVGCSGGASSSWCLGRGPQTLRHREEAGAPAGRASGAARSQRSRRTGPPVGFLRRAFLPRRGSGRMGLDPGDGAFCPAPHRARTRVSSLDGLRRCCGVGIGRPDDMARETSLHRWLHMPWSTG